VQCVVGVVAFDLHFQDDYYVFQKRDFISENRMKEAQTN
jgi:hypothetical protein